jgi:putative nucleotidyltransferase with HDIG domain
MSTDRTSSSIVCDLFPAVNTIEDNDLRERVLAVWGEAISQGNAGRGWTAAQLCAVPFTLLAGNNGMGFIDHLNSCAAQCLAIAEVLETTYSREIPICRGVLLSGALLADVGKLFEFELDESGHPRQSDAGRLLRHPFTGVAIAQKHGLPAEVLHIIAAHSHEGDRIERSIECIIFHHADFIDFDIAKAIGREESR